jgi:hypothetical protein
VVARRPLRVNEGAGHSAFRLAFGALRHLRTLMTFRLSNGLVWRGNFLLPARHLDFGLVTRRSLSGRWHFDLLNVSNGHDTKHRPSITANQANPLPRRDIPVHRYDFLAEHAFGSGLFLPVADAASSSTSVGVALRRWAELLMLGSERFARRCS